MQKRQQILELLNVQPSSLNNYDKLIASLVLNEEDVANDLEPLHQWFKSCVESLFYKVNHTMPVLIGEQGIGKTVFFRNLVPKEFGYSEFTPSSISANNSVYSEFLASIGIDYRSEIKITNYLLSSEEFIIIEDENNKYPTTDKRLSNFCCTSNNHDFVTGRRIFPIFLKSIDWNIYNSIDKTDLWRELFWKHSPVNNQLPLSKESINKIFNNPYQMALSKIKNNFQ